MGDHRVLVIDCDDLRALDSLRDLSGGALSREDVLGILQDYQSPGEPLLIVGGRIPDHIDLYPSLPERRRLSRDDALAEFQSTAADTASQAAADAKRSRKNARRLPKAHPSSTGA